MKKVTLSFLTIFTFSGLYPQSYEINFTGAGAITSVDSVLVENTTQGTSLTLDGDDVLQLNIITGIYTHDFNFKSLKICPNPMTSIAELEFFTSRNGNVRIAVYDISGRTVIQSNACLNNGAHKYHITGLQQGIYIVHISDQNSSHAVKLISQNDLLGEVNIEYVSFNNMSSQTSIKGLKSSISTIVMDYHNGDRLKLTGISGVYRTVLMDVPTESKTTTFTFVGCTDGDSNNYPVVTIGTQTWMAENLRTTKYNDGTAIPLVTEDTAWAPFLTTPAYCWYNNDSATYSNTYGALYNWHTVNAGKLCPTGWHVPTDAEWTTLTDYLGGISVAGGKLKESDTTHWTYPNTGATNESGFTALPGGYRDHNFGSFSDVGNYGLWWSSTESDPLSAWFRAMYYNYGGVASYPYGKRYGYSVRCLGD